MIGPVQLLSDQIFMIASNTRVNDENRRVLSLLAVLGDQFGYFDHGQTVRRELLQVAAMIIMMDEARRRSAVDTVDVSLPDAGQTASRCRPTNTVAAIILATSLV